MSIMLYQPGEDHVVDGVSCNVITCELHEMDGLLSEGWFKSVEDFAPKKKKKPKEEPEVEADSPEE